MTKYNDKGLAARCARGVEGKGERLVPTYLWRCPPLGEQNKKHFVSLPTIFKGDAMGS